MSSILQEFVRQGDLLPLVAIVGGLTVGVIAIVFTMIRGMYVAKVREQTKRELAAYVAEGTLDPDKAVALMKADRQPWEVGKDRCAVSTRAAQA